MYSGFITGMKWLGNLLDENLMLWVAIGVLGGILLYQIIMTIVISLLLREHARSGKCFLIVMNDFRRFAATIIAWVYLIFMILNIVDLDGVLFDVSIEQVMLPVAFMVVFYLIEVLFMAINRCKCNVRLGGSSGSCNCNGGGCSGKKEVVKTAIKEEPKISTEEVKEFNEAKVNTSFVEQFAVQSEEEASEGDSSVVEMTATATTEETTVDPESQASEMIATPEAVESIDAISVKAKAIKAKVGATPRKTYELLSMEKRNEKIEELGAKIERQRQQAERQTDTMVIEDLPYSSARTQEAIHSADETASKMDELQRRMDALRKTVKTRDVDVTENISRQEYTSRQESHSVSQQRSVLELRREQETLKKQYETLQNKLEQIKSERINEEARRDVGFYSDNSSFEKTGPSEHLSKLPSHNKFDQEEVERALIGLKSAMEGLQKQIDANNG